MPIKQLWRRLFSSDEVQFQVLKSTSALELTCYNNNSSPSKNRQRTPTRRSGTNSGHGGGRRGRNGRVPRYYSHYDDCRVPRSQSAAEDDIKIVNAQEYFEDDHHQRPTGPSSSNNNNNNDAINDYLDSSGRNSGDGGRGDQSGRADKTVIVFGMLEAPMSYATPLSHIPEELLGGDDPSSSSAAAEAEAYLNYSAVLQDPCLDAALACCHVYRQHSNFHQGLLLKCVEGKALYPYIHMATFHQEADNGTRFQSGSLAKLNRASQQQSPNVRQQNGIYTELCSIMKRTADPSLSNCRLPASRNTGYIIIGYKLLQTDIHGLLEKSWLNWTGAREIYKYCPRSWNMRRITLHKMTGYNPGQSMQKSHGVSSTPLNNQSNSSQSAGSQSQSSSIYDPSSMNSSFDTAGFAYILLCEFGNLMQADHIVEGYEVVERLKARNCGHVGLYKVQWTYNQQSGMGSNNNSNGQQKQQRQQQQHQSNQKPSQIIESDSNREIPMIMADNNPIPALPPPSSSFSSSKS